jgi:hypothetical protein
VQPPKYFVENVKALLVSIFDKLEDPSDLYSTLYDSTQTRIPIKLEELSLSVVEKSGDPEVKKEEVPRERGEGCGAKNCDGWGNYECDCMVQRLRG